MNDQNDNKICFDIKHCCRKIGHCHLKKIATMQAYFLKYVDPYAEIYEITNISLLKHVFILIFQNIVFTMKKVYKRLNASCKVKKEKKKVPFSHNKNVKFLPENFNPVSILSFFSRHIIDELKVNLLG